MSSRTRRRVLKAAVSGVAGMTIGKSLRLAVAQSESTLGAPLRLDDDLYVLSAGGTNIVAHTDSDGVVLVDGGPASTAEAVNRAVSELSASGPIHTLFNTHWHPEQTGLNEAMGRAGAKIIAQENTRLWLTTDITYPWDGKRFDPLPEIARPNSTFFDEGELQSGIRYGYLRHAAHTDGDLFVYFPNSNVLAVGGAASGASWPFVDWWTGGWIGGIVGTMELLLALSDAETRFVPAEGRILSRADIEAQYEMYNTIFERLSRLVHGGMGPDEAIADHPTAEFDAEMGPPDQFVRRAFESLWAYLSPDA